MTDPEGLLDTSALPLLSRIADPEALPHVPLYTANPDDFGGIDGLVVRPVRSAGP